MSDTKIYPTTYLDLPTGDGLPMGETEAHGIEMSEFFRDVLRVHYADDPMVYVASNNFVYYDPGNVKKNVCPDCYVIKGIPKIVRDSYQSWAEGGALPCLVLELTSKSTWRTDIGHKKDLYQTWGCNEYFLYDLTADKLQEHLIGYRLRDGVYEELSPNSQGRLYSEELGLELAHDDGHLRFFGAGSPLPIATRWEGRAQERLRADQAERGRKRAEEEIRRLNEELARLRERKNED
ncbi:MAG: Uma2 family endonuclease [Planctomycetota bacterium]|nr:Uma2 family endonuclease [Planctomycetota bacterium]